MQPVPGLHHVTAVANDPQTNIHFYTRILGQRLVKKTVNFDDPQTYHFYFGDETGTPGTILTFFPWPSMRRGQKGNGETTAVAYTIPDEAIPYWQARLFALGISSGELQQRFGQTVLPLTDPDGMQIELIGSQQLPAVNHWPGSPVPSNKALHGFHSVTLWLGQVEPTAAVLTEQLGYQFVGQEGNRYRYQAAAAANGQPLAVYIDILHRPGAGHGRFGAGSIHHIAFQLADDDSQLAYLQQLQMAGLRVTDVQDRQYFRSIYFREPGKVLFELATNGPGFASDEPVATLGSQLKLPPWLEAKRAEIEAALPPISLTES